MGGTFSARAARALLALTGIGMGACGGPAAPQGSGSPCFRATECAAGLVCIERRCTADLTSVDRPVARPDASTDAGAGGPTDDAASAEQVSEASEADPAAAEADAATQ
jgi:hypothetical protein